LVIDAYSRMVVGWQLATHLRTDLALDALEMAIWQRNGAELDQLVHHSDRGVQGGFNWWSQHLDLEVCVFGTTTGLGCGCNGQAADAVTWSTAGGAAGASAAFLGGNRARCYERGRGRRSWCVAGGRKPLVP
jgi:hypothetical protein